MTVHICVVHEAVCHRSVISQWDTWGGFPDYHIISNIFQRTAGLSEPLWDAGVYGPFRNLSAGRKGCAIFLSANSMTSVCLQCDM
jgi:hypothetical protein